MARAGKKKPGKTKAKPKPGRVKAKPKTKPRKAKKPALRAKKKPLLKMKKKPLPKARPRAKAAAKKPKIAPRAKPIEVPPQILLPKPAQEAPAAMISGPAEEKHEEAAPQAPPAPPETGKEQPPSWMKKKIARVEKKEEKPEEELTPEEKIERMFPEEKPEEKKEAPEEAHEKKEEKREEKEEAGEIEPEAPPEEEKPEEAEKAPEEEPEKEGAPAEKEEEKPEEAFPEKPQEPEEEKHEETEEEKPAEPEEEKPEELPKEKEEPPEPVPEEKLEEEERPKIIPPKPEMLAKAVPGEVVPAFEILPEWEDRRRLRRVVEEGSISLFVPRAGSRDNKEALRLISRKAETASAGPGYSLICAKDRTGKLVGATDFCVIRDGNVVLLALMHLSVFTMDKKRDLLMVLYAAALGAAKPTHVMCRIPKPDLGKADDVGRLIFFGRGLGMSAIPLNHPKALYFVRRIGKEHEPVMFGEQISMLVGMSEKAYRDKPASALSAALPGKEGIPLIMLPSSPDYGEHLHELKDAVMALGLSTSQLDSAFPALETQYLKGRADITPAALL